ncbi:DNA/RNA non-specific endonuclease [Vibrio sp. THAF190c]|uniref:DNA/RNA non-specific endonuclease n=1 Tax=Vibrio sp. THAF190c TaxID=2587865 RepID=UPI0012AA8ECE|nr:DNA/RNA non-specific endonuclease [Vibrio sp. THAF190c]QFT13511.1 Nuclease precursor [Vibrio sp. THAF190c]
MSRLVGLLFLMLSFSTLSEVHTPHCIGGCPEGVKASNDLIVREIYTISSNDDTKFTDWAAYVVTKKSIKSGCSRRWKADPLLTNVETLSPKDYKGAHEAIGIDRGHQVPLASVCGFSGWKEANYLSNITPQRSELNQGPWKYLEEKVRKLVKERGVDAYVLTGPLYEREMPKLPHTTKKHTIPSGYWKVVGFKEGKQVYLESFIMDQRSRRSDKFCGMRVTLNNVEERSGLDLFPSLPDTIEIVESKSTVLCR